MLVDRLLSALEVSVEPFAICTVCSGWTLEMPPPGSVGIHYVLRGEGNVVVPGGPTLPFTSRSLIVIPPGAAHRIEPHGAPCSTFDVAAACRRPEPGVRWLMAGDGASTMLIACGVIQATYAGGLNLFAHLRAPLVVSFEEDDPVTPAFAGLLEEQARPGAGSDAMMSAYMTQGLITLVRRLGEGEGGGGEAAALSWLQALEDPRLARALDHMLAAPADSHTLESLARVAGMSRSSFSGHFTQTFGTPPMELLRETRLRRAAQLLRTSDKAIKRIAAEVGYASRSHFSRAFKAFTGVEPTQYRAGA